MLKVITSHIMPASCFLFICFSAFAQQTVFLEAGPIKDAIEAPQKCERARVNWRTEHQNTTDVAWTGNWEERNGGKNAVCEISYIEQLSASRNIQLDAGPISSNDEAADRCNAAGQVWLNQNTRVRRFRWTGQWHSTGDGTSAMCEFRYTDPDTPTGQTEVQTIAIANQADAAVKCEEARTRWQARQPDVQTSRWTGEWTQTTEGRYVCMVDYTTDNGRPLQFHDVQAANQQAN